MLIGADEISDLDLSDGQVLGSSVVPDDVNKPILHNVPITQNEVFSKTKETKKRVHIANDNIFDTSRKRSKRSRSVLNEAQIDSVLKDLDEEIGNALQHTTYNNKLTPANVKTILRHVIANEYVLAMVRNTMKLDHSDEESEECVIEPKLTRSKAKEMRQKHHSLPWPVSSPVHKADTVTKKILEEEFPEESSDEDYNPTEEEIHSEDDDAVSSKASDMASPCAKPESQSSAPIQKILEHYAEDENALVIALPDPDYSPSTSEADKIALRTRSKLCLNDTSLEAIEASFIAPDITMDMYDTKCDDEEWMTFLKELTKPIESIFSSEQPGQDVDDVDDPEYNVHEEEDVPDYSDLRYDNSVKITRDELNSLMAELLEYAQQDLNLPYEDDDEILENHHSAALGVSDVRVENIKSQWMDMDERLQLGEQMRMYVQLLSQSYLLSHGNAELNFLNVSSKLFLDEIKMFASREMATGKQSAFYAENLDQALDLVNDYEKQHILLRSRPREPSKSNKFKIQSAQVKKSLATSKVFIYPELLPTCGYLPIIEKQKITFVNAEDNLIALGLEQFSGFKNPLSLIHTLLLPTKTEHQIKIRIKNAKCPRMALDNPIKYYFTHNKAPEFQRVIRIFDPCNVKAPEDYPPDVLPNWMESFSKHVSDTSPLHLTPRPSTPHTKVYIFQPPMVQKPPSVRKLIPILPRGVHLSPLKQISPILRKYNQQRRILPPSNNKVSKRKNRKFVTRRKPAPIKPKSVKGQNIKIEQTQNVQLSPTKERNRTLRSSKIAPISKPVILETENIKDKLPSKPMESEGLEEFDEEVAEEEHDTTSNAAIVNNPVIKKQIVNKKRNRLQKDLEATLKLLQPDILKSDCKNEERELLFADQYLSRVTETLKDKPDILENFLTIICQYQYSTKSPVKLYSEIKAVLKDYPLLVEDFVAFLQPNQAKECGKYKEYVLYCQRREFIRKIELHFSNQPHKIERIIKTISQVSQQDITSVEVLNALQPVLRNQSHLIEELSHLLPHAPVPESMLTDFEEAVIPNSDDDCSSVGSCEEVVIPDTVDPYGGKDCPCDCHRSSTDNKLLNKSRHCVKCGVKFIDGRIYIQTGKVLKPAQVIYHKTPKLPEIDHIETKPSCKIQSNIDHSKATSHPLPSNITDSASTKKSQQYSISAYSDRLNINNPTPSSSTLPCDVIEDTVFPAMRNDHNKSIPPDFSHIRDIIVKDNSKKNEVSTSDAYSPKQKPNLTWSKDEDKLIVYNCQRFGITKKAFLCSASAIESRSAEEVEERFIYLMKLLSKELKKK